MTSVLPVRLGYEQKTPLMWDLIKKLQLLILFNDSLFQPTGLDIYNERLLVADYFNGDIIIYNLESNSVDRLGKIETGLQNEIIDIKVDNSGSIWIVCKNSH